MSFEGVEPQRQVITLELGYILQRLFSTFPNSWPGIGLLLLRICLSIALLRFSISGLSSSSELISFAPELIAAIGGALLLAGLWTPATGILVALDEVWIVLCRHTPGGEDVWIHLWVGMLAVSVAMTGPGAWSIDARLFGRQRFDLDRGKGRNSSL